MLSAMLSSDRLSALYFHTLNQIKGLGAARLLDYSWYMCDSFEFGQIMGWWRFDQTGCLRWRGGSGCHWSWQNPKKWNIHTHSALHKDPTAGEASHTSGTRFTVQVNALTTHTHTFTHAWTHTNTRVKLNHRFTDLWQQSLLLGLHVHLGSLNGSAATKMWLTNRQKARRIQGGRELVLSDLYSLWICCSLTLWN